MAKDDSKRKEKKEKKEKREKRDKKEKRSDKDGVHKSSKKERKEKTAVIDESKADRMLHGIGSDQPKVAIQSKLNGDADTTMDTGMSYDPSYDKKVAIRPKVNGDAETNIDVEMSEDENPVPEIKPRGALVPFANPLADEKTAKKVFKSVKKATKSKTLKRGVKEVVKALRKSPMASAKSVAEVPIGVLIIAADISPMDVISHLPVLAEDHGIPYVYVTSRAELGAASSTKRPTSVVLIDQKMNRKGKARKEKKEGDTEGKEKSEEDQKKEWEEVYGDLVRVVKRAGRHVRI